MENEYSYQILRLSECFYRDYPNPPYVEILKSNTEPIIACFFKHNPSISFVFLTGQIFHIRMPIFLKNQFVPEFTSLVLTIPKW